jgi:hypothetical protein
VNNREGGGCRMTLRKWYHINLSQQKRACCLAHSNNMAVIHMTQMLKLGARYDQTEGFGKQNIYTVAR